MKNLSNNKKIIFVIAAFNFLYLFINFFDYIFKFDYKLSESVLYLSIPLCIVMNFIISSILRKFDVNALKVCIFIFIFFAFFRFIAVFYHNCIDFETLKYPSIVQNIAFLAMYIDELSSTFGYLILSKFMIIGDFYDVWWSVAFYPILQIFQIIFFLCILIIGSKIKEYHKKV